MDAYIGEIRAFPYSYVPYGWLACEGQQLPVIQYQALASLLGSYFGPSTQTFFYLPDLRSATPIGQGDGMGLTPRDLGQNGGAATAALTNNNLPRHSHGMGSAMTSTLGCNSGIGGVNTPVGNIEAAETSTSDNMYKDIAPEIAMAPGTVVIYGTTAPVMGNSTPHQNLMPTLVFRYCICNDGYYPLKPD